MSVESTDQGISCDNVVWFVEMVWRIPPIDPKHVYSSSADNIRNAEFEMISSGLSNHSSFSLQQGQTKEFNITIVHTKESRAGTYPHKFVLHAPQEVDLARMSSASQFGVPVDILCPPPPPVKEMRQSQHTPLFHPRTTVMIRWENPCQGPCCSKYRYNVYRDNELVSALTYTTVYVESNRAYMEKIDFFIQVVDEYGRYLDLWL